MTPLLLGPTAILTPASAQPETSGDVALVASATSAAAAAGRSGTGTKLGVLPRLKTPAAGAMGGGNARTAVANLPSRLTNWRFANAIKKLTASSPDFLALNEVGGRSLATITAKAPGYAAYRDPIRDTSAGGVQSMNNVVLWRTNRWSLKDAGRVKLVDNDKGYHAGTKFDWDRYASWTLLRRKDGPLMSVISTHMPTNPAKYPRQWGGVTKSRVQKYSEGMDIMVRLSRILQTRGPVTVSGDMNSHLSQGSWTAAAKLKSAGYEWTKGKGVIYNFCLSPMAPKSSYELNVRSDHPALLTTNAFNEAGPKRR